MTLFSLAIKSLLSRKLSTFVLIFSLSLSICLLIGIERLQDGAKTSFATSISGTDLIIGARTGDTQLLMASVFRQGAFSQTMSWSSFQTIQSHPSVKWAVPISLGDSHKGYPVMGTSIEYFDVYKYSHQKKLQLSKGRLFQKHTDIVLGASVAKTLDYDLKQTLFLSHGVGKNVTIHKNQHFTVVGILHETGTPVDNTIHIPLEGFHSLHTPPNASSRLPNSISAAFLGLRSKFSIFTMQRTINNFSEEALMAIIPGLALSQLWSNLQIFERTFTLLSYLVVLIAFLGLLASLFITFQQQKHELSILRSLGASPYQLIFKLMIESLIMTGTSILIALIFLWIGHHTFGSTIEDKTGLLLNLSSFKPVDSQLFVSIMIFSTLLSVIPAILSYRQSLHEGFSSL